jgi:glucosamine--fructose-6-phosphate aminotransferase (isomerizing)
VPARRRRRRDERFLASDVSAFLSETRRVQWIENGELVVIRPGETTILTPEGEVLDREVSELDWDQATAEKEGYETFMLKEIHEQAEMVAETIIDRTHSGTGVDFSAEFDEDLLRDAERIIVIACGTSYHAGVLGKYAMVEWARMPVGIDVASEYRYSNPVVGPATWSSASPSPARPPTRWPPCAWRRSAARRCWRSPT